MKIRDWLRPGLSIKRWIATALAGVLALGLSASGLMTMIGIKPLGGITLFIVAAIGLLLEFTALRGLLHSFIGFRRFTTGLGNEQGTSNRAIVHEKILMRGPKIVALGGGTGLSVLLRGLKNYTSNITAVVTVADDGGGSGVLRSDLGMLPPGDIRNCILALADTEPVMEQLLQYRFQSGRLKGQSFGNLLIAAMDGISGSFEEAVRRISQVLAVTGQVLPCTLEDVSLCARLKNGGTVAGESNIPIAVLEQGSPIDRVFIKPEEPEPLDDVIAAIDSAQAIVLGPGSLYTSIIPNLLTKGIVDAINRSEAPKIYVCNIMTQPGETDGLSVSEHVRVLEEHAGLKFIDYVVVNNGEIEEEYLARYSRDHSVPVPCDEGSIRPGIKVVKENLVSVNKGYLRHDSIKLAQLIIKIANPRDIGILDYYNIFTSASAGRRAQH